MDQSRTIFFRVMLQIDQKVSALYAPKRLDAYLVETFRRRFSRQEIKSALIRGKLLLNGKPAKPKSLVKNGDEVRGELALAGSGPATHASAGTRDCSLRPEKIDLKIIYEDKNILVVDKPAGLVVHPGAGHRQGTLVNALLGKGTSLSSVGEKERPGIVHRLDKDTSGVLIVAKDNLSHRKLQEQFASRTLSKTYLALVKGRVEFEEGRISKAIGRDEKNRLKMAVSGKETAREAETVYKVLKRFRYSTLLEVKILTGRTHQIRVHLADLGHPVVGDALYGRADEAGRLALHAWKIEFSHPKTGKIIKCESPIPEALKAWIDSKEKEK